MEDVQSAHHNSEFQINFLENEKSTLQKQIKELLGLKNEIRQDLILFHKIMFDKTRIEKQLYNTINGKSEIVGQSRQNKSTPRNFKYDLENPEQLEVGNQNESNLQLNESGVDITNFTLNTLEDEGLNLNSQRSNDKDAIQEDNNNQEVPINQVRSRLKYLIFSVLGLGSLYLGKIIIRRCRNRVESGQ